MKSKRLLIVLVILVIASLACGQFSIGLESPTQEQGPAPANVQTIEKPDSGLVDLPAPETDSVSEGGSLYWSEAVDDRFGVRFAVPCFWQVLVPPSEQDPSGYGSFPINNFTQEYIDSLGPKRGGLVWEQGGMKIDIGYLKAEQYGLTSAASMEELVAAMYPADKPLYSAADLLSAEPKTINGQSALEITTSSKEFETISTYYLFQVSPGLFLTFNPYPSEALSHPDIQGILNSIALTPSIEVNVPDIFPANPPAGMEAPCMKAITESLSIDEGQDVEGYSCESPSPESLDWLVCKLQFAIRSRNLSTMLSNMANPFPIGYWLSEWTSNTPEYSIDMIQRHFLPADTSGLIFTTDRTQFPDLSGFTPLTPEEMMGPDTNVVEVIFTSGWFENQSAFLFLAQDETGNYYWAGILIGRLDYKP